MQHQHQEANIPRRGQTRRVNGWNAVGEKKNARRGNLVRKRNAQRNPGHEARETMHFLPASDCSRKRISDPDTIFHADPFGKMKGSTILEGTISPNPFVRYRLQSSSKREGFRSGPSEDKNQNGAHCKMSGYIR